MGTQDPSVQRVATRFRREAAGDPPDVIRQMLTIHGRIQTWLRAFPSSLREAKRGAPSGYAWQEPFVGFFEGYDLYQRQLFDLGRKLGSKSAAKFAVEPPRGARVNQAIRDIEFADDDTGQSSIIYPESNLTSWYQDFMKWTVKAGETLRSLL